MLELHSNYSWSNSLIHRHMSSYDFCYGLSCRHLPRHQFGNLQAKMFPAYFRLTSTCMATCVGVMAILRPWFVSSIWEKAQFVSLGVSLSFTLANLLVMEPITTQVLEFFYFVYFWNLLTFLRHDVTCTVFCVKLQEF